MRRKKFLKSSVLFLILMLVFCGQAICQEEEVIQMRPDPLAQEKSVKEPAGEPLWINTGNGPGGEKPLPSSQEMQPSDPERSMRPRTPAQTMRPSKPTHSMRPRTPAQTMRPSKPTHSMRPRTPAQTMRPSKPAHSMRPRKPVQSMRPRTQAQ